MALRQATLISISGGVTSYRTIESDDVPLATCASGGTQVGGDINAVIPTHGLIRVTVVRGSLKNTDTAHGLCGMGIEVNGSSYFAQYNDGSGTQYYAPAFHADDTGNREVSIRSGYASYNHAIPFVEFDINAEGIATGTQVLKIKMGDTAYSTWTGSLTLMGNTTENAVFHVEIFEAS